MNYMVEAMRVLRKNVKGLVSLEKIKKVEKHLKENNNEITREALENIIKGE